MAGYFFAIIDFLLLCYLWGTCLQYNTEAHQASSEEKKVLDAIKKQIDEGKKQQEYVKNLVDRIAAEIERTNCTDPPEITDISSNQTKNEGDVLTLSCTAYGDPTPNITWTRVSDKSVVTFPLTISGKQDEGIYKCTADNDVGNAATRTVNVFVQNYRPINTRLSSELNYVVVNATFNITCSAQANPPAKYRFYKEHESLFNTTTGSDAETYTTSVGERGLQVNYRCTPFNEYGDGPKEIMTITVIDGIVASHILSVLNRRYRDQLNSYLVPVLHSSSRGRFAKCWHAKADGWTASTFHSNCDGKGPTVTIIQVGNYIFGGYTDVSWYSGSCRYVSSSKSFIFSLYNINGYAPVKLQIKSGKTRTAIFGCSDRGPSFGGGHDIHISNNAGSNRKSYTYCGETYPLPPGYSSYYSSCTFYAGSYYKFTPTDVEVFYEITT